LTLVGIDDNIGNMKLIITFYHGLSAELDSKLNAIGKRTMTNDASWKRTCWEYIGTLDSFMQVWHDKMLIIPITEENKSSMWFGDYLVYITDQASFNTR
jgi:hypothetical protein